MVAIPRHYREQGERYRAWRKERKEKRCSFVLVPQEWQEERLFVSRFRSSVLQHAVIHLVHVLRHLWSSALQGELGGVVGEEETFITIRQWSRSMVCFHYQDLTTVFYVDGWTELLVWKDEPIRTCFGNEKMSYVDDPLAPLVLLRQWQLGYTVCEGSVLTLCFR